MHDSHILVLIHITAGTLGIFSGFLAMALRKGSPRHRLVGNVFTVSMLTMSSVAAYMAYVGTEVKQPTFGNVMGGMFTFYLVGTAWLAARHKDGERGAIDWVAFLFISAIVVGLYAYGLGYMHPAVPTVEDPPAAVPFILGSIALIAAIMDLRMLVWGISGAQRIIRHLWRMCFATWFAASSLFLGQPQVFPLWLHKTHLLVVPSLVIHIYTIYWIIRTVRNNAYKQKPVATAAPWPEITSQSG
jgi:hypothetical protein